jgi:hypothetical protein
MLWAKSTAPNRRRYSVSLVEALVGIADHRKRERTLKRKQLIIGGVEDSNFQTPSGEDCSWAHCESTELKMN